MGASNSTDRTRITDDELHLAIEQSAFHVGMESSKVRQLQDNYRKAVSIRLMPKAIQLISTLSKSLVTGKYRQAIKQANKLVALMERISED